MGDRAALVLYCLVLWVALFGALAFEARAPVTRQAKALLAVTFVALVVDGGR